MQRGFTQAERRAATPSAAGNRPITITRISKLIHCMALMLSMDGSARARAVSRASSPLELRADDCWDIASFEHRALQESPLAHPPCERVHAGRCRAHPNGPRAPRLSFHPCMRRPGEDLPGLLACRIA